MNTKRVSFALSFCIAVLAVLFIFPDKENFLTYKQNAERTLYRERLQKIKPLYYQGMEISKKDNGEKDAYDNPDLAVAFDYYKRINPVTMKIPANAWLNAYKDLQRIKSSSRSMAGLAWTARGPNNVGGRTRAIMIDPNDVTKKTIWAGGVDGGLWKTTDITAASPVWTFVDDFFANLAVNSIAYDPSSTMTMYFGTGEGWYNGDNVQGAGIWKSTDGGSTWAQLASTNNSTFYFVQKIVVDAVGNVFAATRGGGIQKSTNGGTSWIKVLGSGVTATTNTAADIEIAANGDLYASMGISATDGIYKSTNSGTSWTKQAGGLPASGYQRIELACAPSSSGTVYAVMEDGSTSGALDIYQTTNGGTTWTAKTLPVDDDGSIGADFTRTQAWYDLIIAVDPNSSGTLIMGGVDLFKSTDGATSWSQLSHWYGGFGYQEVHADQHAIVFEEGSSSVVYFGNDGGVWRSTDGGTTITQKNSSYVTTQFYSVAINPTSGSNIIIGGTQDNGTNKLSSAGMGASTEIYGGDGGFTAISFADASDYYTTYVYEELKRSTNAGGSFTALDNTNLSSSTTLFINPFEMDPNNADILYMASTALWRHSSASTGTSAGWTQASSSLGTDNISAIGISKSTANMIFFGTESGSAYRITNGSTSTSATAPTDISGTLPAGYISCVAVDPADAAHVLVCFSSFGMVNVYESTNATAVSPTWTSLDNGSSLPDIPVNWAVFAPGSSTQVYIATDVGVFYASALSGASTVWTAESSFPNVRTDMLRIRTSDNVIAAGTHGRGIWTAQLFTVPVADFSANFTTRCLGQSITFTDLSTGPATSWAWDIDNSGTTDYTTQNPTHTYSAAGTYSVKLTATNGSGSDSETKISYIIINALPVANAGNDTAICNGQSANLSASGGTSYVWSPSTGLSCTSCASPVASPTTTTTYTVTATDANSCTDTDNIIVTVNALPTANAGSDVTICIGDNTNLSASGGTSYSWTPAGSLSDPNISNPIASPTITTTYTVTATDANSCDDTDNVIVTVTDTAGADFTFSGDPGVTFTNTSTNASSYFWDFGDGNTSTSTNPVHTYTTDDTFDVMLIAINSSCPNDTIIKQVIITGIVGIENSRKNAEFYLTVIPNPIQQGNALIKYFLPARSDISVELFSSYGRRLKNIFSGSQAGGTYEIKLNTSEMNLPGGVYFVVLQMNSPKGASKRYYQKFLIIK